MDGEITRITIPTGYAMWTGTIITRRGPMRTAMTTSRTLDTRISTAPRRIAIARTTTTITIPGTIARTARLPTTTTVTIRNTAAHTTMPHTATTGDMEMAQTGDYQR